MAKRGKRKRKRKPLGVIWEIPDELWERIEPILRDFWPQKATGRRTANWRKMLNAIIFRMRSSCQWDQLPEKFGPKSTIHDWFQRWNKNGIMAKIMAMLVEECNEAGGVGWEWQSADGALAKARFGGIKSAQTPRTERKMAPSGA